MRLAPDRVTISFSATACGLGACSGCRKCADSVEASSGGRTLATRVSGGTAGLPRRSHVRRHMPNASHGAVGSKARLALALLLTGQRRSDVVRMGWQHLSGSAIAVK
jgi:hypothetical protein